MKRTLVASFSFMALVACSDNTIHSLGDGSGANGPQILVEPDQLDFGEAARDEWMTKVFTVTNIGEEELHVSDIHIGTQDDGFYLGEEAYDFVLPAGASQEVVVDWTPFGVDQKNNVIVESNDPDVAKAVVELRGQGLVPELKIAPSPYDFGDTYVGCAHEGDMTLTNVGSDSLEVQFIDVFNGGQFTVENPTALPVTLAPGDSIPLYVDFDPDEDIEYEGEIVVTSTEPAGTRTAVQTGAGLYTAEYKEKWEVPFDPPSDIMFLVDQSCSMDDDQATLAANFSYFISNLNTYTTDWQIIVVNDDDGCTNSGILSPGASQYADRFSAAVSKGGGNYTESLLTPAAYATRKTSSGQCNSGFMRAGALLHIITVSDEPEQSQWYGPDYYSWSSAVTEMIANKGSASLVKVSAIVGDYPSGCGSADAGTGYYEAANYTGGEFLSICASKWDGYMSSLAKASISQDTYELKATPVESTLVVLVNDVERGGGWHFDATSNSVVIETDVPEGGDVVKISYAGLANCD